VPLFQRPPSGARDIPAPGERPLAWGHDVDGAWVVASDAALYLPGAAGHDRLAYDTVASATWRDPLLEVVVVGTRGSRRVVDLAEPGLLPPTVRERVTATVVVSERVPLAGGGRALVSARRPPGGSRVRWNVVFDPGVDPADPLVRADADAAIAALRQATGL